MSQKLYEADPVTAWAEDVVAEKIVAGPHIRNTAQRHLDDLETGADRGLVWDVAAAKRVIEWFPKYLRLKDGKFEGKPFVLAPSQQFRVGSIFGWLRDNGRRRFRRFYDEEGKGNGKSPMLAGIGLYGLVADNESGAEIYAAASKKDQARILFNDAVSMRRQSPELNARIKIRGQEPVNEMIYYGKRGDKRIFKPISSDDGQSGPRPHVALCDEVHEHRDRMTIDLLERGFKFRENPLLAMATNAGTDRTSICYEEHSHAVSVAVGAVQDDSTFSFVCSLDETDDWINDPTCWAKANPLLNVILEESYLAGVVAQARAMPGKQNHIARLHFCVWTDAHTAWISTPLWSSCEDPEMQLQDFEGAELYVGLDLSSTRDMTARALCFCDGVTDDGKPKYALFAQGYMAGDTLQEREIADNAPYTLWARENFITPTPGKTIGLDWLARDLADDAMRFDLRCVAYDSWLYKRFAEEIDALGVELPVVVHPQGFSHRKDSPLFMPDSINALEQLILEKRIRIQVNPALRAAVASATFHESPAGLRRFTKAKAAARIDLAQAAAMAAGAAVGAASGPAEPEYQMMFLG